MIDYYLNWMGPINYDWIQKNGDHWSAGRIDISGTMGNPFGLEYSVPPMHNEDWGAFGYWLDNMQTEEVWPFDKLVEHFQYWHGKEIRWLTNES